MTSTCSPPSELTAPHCLTCARSATDCWCGFGSNSSRGGAVPFIAPYFAAKAAEDALAVSYAAELALFGAANQEREGR
jgi:hypothetical protein